MQSKKVKISLENKLAEMHKRRYCLIVGRGTVAIYLALKALGYKKGKVILPSILCLSPANAVIYAGLKIFFADINLTDFNLDAKDLERILKKEKDVKAVLLPHIYGQPTDINKIIRIIEKYKVKLIEDVAQAMGGRYKGQPLGSFGEFSILSFGYSKILDVGGGGAILFDSKEYLKVIKYYLSNLPIRPKNYKALQNKYRKVYYSLASLIKKDYTLGRLYYTFPYIFKELYLFSNIDTDCVQNISRRLNDLNEIISRRNENAEYYKRYLNHEKIIHPRYRWDGVCWRYTFLIKGANQHRITEKIREKGIDVSNWYPPLHIFYQIYPQKLRNSEYLGKHVFNLWVDSTYSKKDIKKNADIILKIIDKYG